MVRLSIEVLHVSVAVQKLQVTVELGRVPLAGKDEEKGAGAPSEGMEDEICFLGLGILAHTRHAS